MDNPYFIAEQIGGWLTNWETPSVIINNDYAHAPELQVPSMGENLFKTRCSVCHTIGSASGHMVGGGEKIEMNQKRLGPDLMHVGHRRDRAWLARWLADPEQMLAEKDAIAMQIYSEWGEVLMPNLRLNEVEVDALIEYMDAESRRVQSAAPAIETVSARLPLPE
jgi:mono/diheme cytochrome c family protein